MHLLKDENGNVIPHGDGPAHKHEHDHDHGCEEHACDGCSGGSDKCKNESVALLNYMVDHNEHHAAELDQMADNLAKLGMDTAAKQIKEAVAERQSQIASGTHNSKRRAERVLISVLQTAYDILVKGGIANVSGYCI